jgi:hypothetical protein
VGGATPPHGGDDTKRESHSPDVKAESVDTKPIIHSRA